MGAAAAAAVVAAIPAAPVLAAETVASASNIRISVEWSELIFDGTEQTDVILVRHDNFADGLVAGALAGTSNAAVLVTDPDDLSDATLAELDRLNPTRVTILGGTGAVSQDVEDELESLGYDAARLAGDDRVLTAVEVANESYEQPGDVWIARAYGGADPMSGFIDSIGAGMAAGVDAAPLLLTETDELSLAVADYLQDHENSLRTVHIAGGSAAVSDEVEAEIEEMGFEVERHAGFNRYETARALAAFSMQATTEGGDRVVLLNGTDINAWVSGYAVAPMSPGAGIVLTDGSGLPASTRAFLEDQVADETTLFCGPNVSQSLCDQAESLFSEG